MLRAEPSGLDGHMVLAVCKLTPILRYCPNALRICKQTLCEVLSRSQVYLQLRPRLEAPVGLLELNL
jgi:hypothetical protein